MRNGGDGERFIQVPAFDDSPDSNDSGGPNEDDPTDVAQVSRRSAVLESPAPRPSSPGPRSRSKRPPAPRQAASDRKTLLSAPPSEMPRRLAGSRPPVEVTIEEMPDSDDAPVTVSPKKPGAKKAATNGPPSKRAKSISSVPPSKRAPRSRAASGPPSRRSPSRAPASAEGGARVSRVPISFDPKTTLVDDASQRRAVHAVRASVPPAGKGPARRKREREDEISIPPSADLDEHDERFFQEGESLSRPPPQPRVGARGVVVADVDDPVPGPFISPERRKKLTNLVKIAVAVSSVLCFAALARAGATRFSHPAETRVAAAQLAAVAASQTEPAPVAAPAETAQAASALALRASEQAAPVATVAAADRLGAALTDPAAAAALAATEPAVPAAPIKSAKEEKEDARKALEHGKLKDASEAGQRSVALDPTDAEAWLILGSAEQELGHGKIARDEFTHCMKEAKIGPVRECGLMLR